MNKNNLIRFVQSLVLLPAVAFSLGNPQAVNAPQSVLASKLNMVTGALVLNQTDDLGAELKIKGEAIDTYFWEHNMPLEGMGLKMAEEAEKNGLDWRLLAAIAVRESTGGKHECKKVPNNAFGWGSCKIGFKSNEEAIETVAKNLGGNNPNTAKHYDNKTTEGILRAYNPPSIVPKYTKQVISIMDEIGEKDIVVATIKTNA